MNLIVDIVLAMAAITALTVAVWIYLDKPVRSYSIAAFIWLFLVTIVFALSRVMINDGFTSTEMILVGNLIPGIVLAAVIVLLVISVTEILDHIKKVKKHDRSS
jgi:hypothetical protein